MLAFLCFPWVQDKDLSASHTARRSEEGEGIQVPSIRTLLPREHRCSQSSSEGALAGAGPGSITADCLAPEPPGLHQVSFIHLLEITCVFSPSGKKSKRLDSQYAVSAYKPEKTI